VKASIFRFQKATNVAHRTQNAGKSSLGLQARHELARGGRGEANHIQLTRFATHAIWSMAALEKNGTKIDDLR
jgi:hypothetical protein